MKLKKLINISMIFCFQTLTMFAAEIPPTSIEWPAGTEALIDKAIRIKIEAQQQNERMFSEGGVKGHSFVKCLEDLAQILTNYPQIRGKLIEKEGADLKAKIALWSLDRKARSEEYARLEHLYMSDNPIGKEVEARESAAKYKAAANDKGAYGKGMTEGQILNGRLLRRPSPRVSGPPSVSDDDRIERNRWILEYLYFAPPTGHREFDISSTRFILIVALKELCNEKSLVMLKFDNQLQIEAFPQGGATKVGSHTKIILDFRSRLAFSVVSSMMYHNGVRNSVRDFITYLSRILPEDIQNPWYPKLEDYRKLANMEWQTDAEKELASWLKAIPVFPPPSNR